MSPSAAQHAPPPRVPPALRDDSSLTEQGHAGHFLQRVLRCHGLDLDRAMRLYHHSKVVRRVVPDLMQQLLPDQDRAAIPLRDSLPCPHVVVTRSGSFVTCLSEKMGLGGLPVLPYGAVEEHIIRFERDSVRVRRLKSIYAALPPRRLVDGLLAGPGGLTREMIEGVEQAPWAYERLLTQIYAQTLRSMVDNAQAYQERGYSRALRIHRLKIEARLVQCAVLWGVLDNEVTASLEEQIIEVYTVGSLQLAAAIARKPKRGRILLHAARAANPGGEWGRFAAMTGLMHHCLWYPQEAVWIIPALAELPPLKEPGGWFQLWYTEERRAYTPEQTVGFFQDLVDRMASSRGWAQPVSPLWDWDANEMTTLAALHNPVSCWFPPAAVAEEVRRAFAALVRSQPERDPAAPPLRPFVRGAAKVTRNQPCPCGSGAKFKRCCAGKTQSPAPHPHQ